MGRRIVVGVDGSDAGASAMRWVVEEALATTGDVIAVHGFGPLPDIYVTMAPSSRDEWKAEITHALHFWCGPLRVAGVRHSERLLEVDPVTAILQTAQEEHADLVVAGTDNHGVLHRLLGSVTCTLVHRSPVPVVLVPCSKPGDDTRA